MGAIGALAQGQVLQNQKSKTTLAIAGLGNHKATEMSLTRSSGSHLHIVGTSVSHFQVQQSQPAERMVEGSVGRRPHPSPSEHHSHVCGHFCEL